MKEFIDAALQAGELKKLKRAGWRRHGIEDDRRESVADHSFRCEFIAMVLPHEIEVNRDRVMRLMKVHDLPEGFPEVGDITPHDKIDLGAKFQLEKNAMERLCEGLSDGNELLELWMEYENRETPESLVAHDIDKLEMALQALEYEQSHGIDLGEFFTDSASKIKHPSLRKMFEEIMSRRPSLSTHDWVI